MNDDFLKSIATVLENARKNAKTAVNLSMVYAYFEIGRLIVEEEQNGNGRAAYGKQILQSLSEYLTGKFGKGFSADNLKLMRRFYTVYANDQIGETVFPQFENLEIAKRQPLRAAFRDSSFTSSPAKINVGEIFKMLAPDTRMKVI